MILSDYLDPVPSRRQEQPNPLGKFLDGVLRKRGMTDTDFCKSIGLKKGTYSLIKHRPPTEIPKSVDVEAWGNALGLSSSEMDMLRLVAALSWSPELIQKRLPHPSDPPSKGR